MDYFTHRCSLHVCVPYATDKGTLTFSSKLHSFASLSSNSDKALLSLQVIVTAMFLSVVCKNPDLSEDDELAEDEEDFMLRQDQEWLVDPETAGLLLCLPCIKHNNFAFLRPLTTDLISFLLT